MTALPAKSAFTDADVTEGTFKTSLDNLRDYLAERVPGLKSNTALSDASATLTAAQLVGGEFTITPTAARTQTTDTAVNIIAAMAGSTDGSSFEFTVINLADFAVTIALGTGVTLVGGVTVNAGSATFRVRRLTSTTVSVTRLEGVAKLAAATVQTHLVTTSSQAITVNVVTNISGLNAAITPSTASKRIRVTVRWNGEFSQVNSHNLVLGIKRDTTEIGSPAASGLRNVGMSISAQGFYDSNSANTPDSAMYSYIDSPATTSATTYHATVKTAETGTLYNQRPVVDNNDINHERLTSTIILEEID